MTDDDPISVRNSDDITVVYVRGDLDTSNVHSFTTAVGSPLQNGMRVAIIDLNDARYLDSAALRALFQLGAELRTKGGTLVFAAGVDHPLRRLITISGGTEIATLEESVDRALQQHS